MVQQNSIFVLATTQRRVLLSDILLFVIFERLGIKVWTISNSIWSRARDQFIEGEASLVESRLILDDEHEFSKGVQKNKRIGKVIKREKGERWKMYTGDERYFSSILSS